MSLSRLPPQTAGLALGNIGAGVMWLNLAREHTYLYNPALLFFAGLFSAWGTLLLFLCFARIAIYPRIFVAKDLQTPAMVVSVGAISMATALLAVLAQAPEASLPLPVAYFIALSSSALQAFVLYMFTWRCIQTSTFPEPFFNAAVHHLSFTPVSVPGHSQFSIGVRNLFLATSLLLLPFTLLITLYRLFFDPDLMKIKSFFATCNPSSQSGAYGATTRQRDVCNYGKGLEIEDVSSHNGTTLGSIDDDVEVDDANTLTQEVGKDTTATSPPTHPLPFPTPSPASIKIAVVANNPSCCMLQASTSINLTAWLVSPIACSATSGVGLGISNLFFGLSTSVYILLHIALYNRRHALLQMGPNAGWSGATFPYVNTAIAANMYRRVVGSSSNMGTSASTALDVWVWLLSAVATFAVVAINIMYVKSLFFLFNENLAASASSASPVLVASADSSLPPMPYSSVSNESLSLSIDEKTVDDVRMTQVKTQIEETYLETEHHHEGEEKNMTRCLPLYTREEIFKHNKEEDGWFIFDGAVFDATSHLKEIKDTKTSTFLAIVRVLGKDCTHEMQEIGHSARALAQMQAFKIGEVM